MTNNWLYLSNYSPIERFKRVTDIENINDDFQSLITQLSLEYDLKKMKFEERILFERYF